jgi:hypothetical protein
VEDLHQYLQHPRPYKTRFPTILLSDGRQQKASSSTVSATSRELGGYTRQVRPPRQW